MRTALLALTMFVGAAFLVNNFSEHRMFFVAFLILEFLFGAGAGFIAGRHSVGPMYQVLRYRDGYRIRRKRFWGWEPLNIAPLQTWDEAVEVVDEWRNPKQPVVVWEES